MNVSTPQQACPPTNWIAVLGATIVWWFVPVVVWHLPHHDEPSAGFAFACLVGLVVALSLCALGREKRWVVLIWIPLLVWTSFGALAAFDEVASEPHGGPNAAPLEGVVMLIGLAVALILGIAAILCLVWRPRTYSRPLMILALVNTAAVSYATWQGNRQATSQEIFLHILDSSGKPLSGASVRYARYGYGPGGKDVFDAEGGPIVSGEDGIAVIPSRRMRYETKGTISKPGFRDVLFTVDMQYSEWDKDRGVTVSTRETNNIAHGRIPTVEPVTFSINLPPQNDAPDRLHPVKHMEAESDIGQGPQAAHIFNLETGKFSNDPAGDLRFDVFFERDDGGYERARLRISGINGARVLQVPPEISLSASLSPYEHIFRIAPQSGYGDEAVIQRPSDSPEPTIYVAARDGRLYARMTVYAAGRSFEAKAQCRVQLFLNPTGGRQLE